MVAAGAEVVTALVLIVDPGLFAHLLFGGELSRSGQGLGRLGGFALLALAWVCLPSKAAGWSPIPALRAFLLFSLFSAIYLIFLGVRGADVGIILWPAAIAHAVLAALLGWALMRAA